jgi:uncharacterized membrane protein YphA (DoxX/SURF4 family)
MSQLGAAGVLELAGGTLMVVALFSRPVAFVDLGPLSLNAIWRKRR